VVTWRRWQAHELHAKQWTRLLERCSQKCWPSKVWQKLSPSMDQLLEAWSQTRCILSTRRGTHCPFAFPSRKQVHLPFLLLYHVLSQKLIHFAIFNLNRSKYISLTSRSNNFYWLTYAIMHFKLDFIWSSRTLPVLLYMYYVFLNPNILTPTCIHTHISQNLSSKSKLCVWHVTPTSSF